MPREALVDPSTGSTTTVTGAPCRPLHPDSSLSTATGARPSRPRTAPSATRSMAYWPGRPVRARRSGPSMRRRAAATEAAASSKRSSSCPGVTPGRLTAGDLSLTARYPPHSRLPDLSSARFAHYVRLLRHSASIADCSSRERRRRQRIGREMRKLLTLAIPLLLGVGILTAALHPQREQSSSPR